MYAYIYLSIYPYLSIYLYLYMYISIYVYTYTESWQFVSSEEQASEAMRPHARSAQFTCTPGLSFLVYILIHVHVYV